jgi:hypothetical protein
MPTAEEGMSFPRGIVKKRRSVLLHQLGRVEGEVSNAPIKKPNFHFLLFLDQLDDLNL